MKRNYEGKGSKTDRIYTPRTLQKNKNVQDFQKILEEKEGVNVINFAKKGI